MFSKFLLLYEFILGISIPNSLDLPTTGRPKLRCMICFRDKIPSLADYSYFLGSLIDRTDQTSSNHFANEITTILVPDVIIRKEHPVTLINLLREPSFHG